MPLQLHDASRPSSPRGRIAGSRRGLALLVAIAMLAACGKPSSSGANPEGDETAIVSLPRPPAAGGSVTGMPQARGPGDVPLAGAPPMPADDGAQAPSDLFNPETGVLPGDAQSFDGTAPTDAATEPGVADAVAVVREYYASIGSQSYARAYALWSDGGRASRQTPQQFADGFARTAQVSLSIGEPGDEDAGAGQRYVRVPVTVDARQADGSTKRYVGDYVLHRTVADGATPEQRAWRIASADLRELTP